MADGAQQTRPERHLMLGFMRYVLPNAIAVAGVVLIIVGHASYTNLATTHSLETATGVAVIICAICVWMINWMYRLGVSSTLDRQEEERAREYFDRTGRWPDELQ